MKEKVNRFLIGATCPDCGKKFNVEFDLSLPSELKSNKKFNNCVLLKEE